MRTRCPQCQTVYDIDPKALEMAKGMARCFNCNTVFNTLEEDHSTHTNSNPEAQTSATSSNEFADLDIELQLDFNNEKVEQASFDLPFEVPEDLPALQPSEKAALSLQESLYPQLKTPSPWWQKVLALILGLVLISQLIWHYRIPLMQLPQAHTLCQTIDCTEAQQHDANAFVVLQREIEPNPDHPGVLKLRLHFRNDAGFSQPLPDLQLALFDSNENLLARRRISAKEYLFPAPPDNRLIAPQEVVTINLGFEDPGSRASGFKIDFL